MTCPKPKPRTKAVNKQGVSKQSELYHNLDPLYHLIGDVNESWVLVEGQSFLALIGSGSQFSTITKDLVEHLQFPIHNLDAILNIDGMGGCRVPYLGNIEAHLLNPPVRAFDSDVLFLVVPNSTYGDRAPLQVESWQIDLMLDLATEAKLNTLVKTWK